MCCCVVIWCSVSVASLSLLMLMLRYPCVVLVLVIHSSVLMVFCSVSAICCGAFFAFFACWKQG